MSSKDPSEKVIPSIFHAFMKTKAVMAWKQTHFNVIGCFLVEIRNFQRGLSKLFLPKTIFLTSYGVHKVHWLRWSFQTSCMKKKTLYWKQKLIEKAQQKTSNWKDLFYRSKCEKFQLLKQLSDNVRVKKLSFGVQNQCSAAIYSLLVIMVKWSLLVADILTLKWEVNNKHICE